MRNQIPSDKIDHYPDLLSCFRGSCNQRQREEYRRFFYRAIKTQLTQRQKQVVMMHFFDGLTLTEIAKQMCVNKSTVSRTLSRALDRLTDLYIEQLLNTPAKGRHRISMVKDVRIFVNTIDHAIRLMTDNGVPATAHREEKDGYIEYTVRIPTTAAER